MVLNLLFYYFIRFNNFRIKSILKNNSKIKNEYISLSKLKELIRS